LVSLKKSIFEMEEKRNKDSKCMRLPTNFGGNGTQACNLLSPSRELQQ
jgi:hypothetical protein